MIPVLETIAGQRILGMHSKTVDGDTFRFYETEGPASRQTFEDEEEVRQRYWHVQPGNTVIDIGAGMGSYTLPACAAYAGRVLAFCPQQPDLDILRANIHLNEYDATGVCEIIPYGLYSHEGWMEPDGTVMRYSPQPIPKGFYVLPLDWIDLADLHKLDWLKIDAEGAEAEILKGAKHTLRSMPPREMLIECHQFMDATLEQEVRAEISAIGIPYRISRHERHAVCHLHCRREGP